MTQLVCNTYKGRCGCPTICRTRVINQTGGCQCQTQKPKRVKCYWSCPLWVSLALQIYQMKLIGNTLSLWSWETCLSGVTFLPRFSDSLQCLQSRWKMREVRGGKAAHSEVDRWIIRAHPLSCSQLYYICWGFINPWGSKGKPICTLSVPLFPYLHKHSHLCWSTFPRLLLKLFFFWTAEVMDLEPFLMFSAWKRKAASWKLYF